ncbi:hypothetical protein K3495_g10572 [Podosphaera aphanis]|nr:hypothetical protein K3495_g10572 [Podosphaera aphanis]
MKFHSIPSHIGLTTVTDDPNTLTEPAQQQPNQQPQQPGIANIPNITASQYQVLREMIIAEIANQQTQPSQSHPPQQSVYPQLSPTSYLHQQPYLPHQTHPTQLSQPLFINSTRQPSQWPVWDGLSASFNAHLFFLRIKVEEDRAILGSDRAICYDISRSVPSKKQPRIQNWLETGGLVGKYDWNQFLDH